MQVVPSSSIPHGWMGLDIGPDSVKAFCDALETTKTVIWNGPMGVFEFDKFAVGTEVCICVYIQNLFLSEVCTCYPNLSVFFLSHECIICMCRA